ncbi:glutamate-5-semialdehyde dehydrogenase [Varunaivibrio sulfuroxidans]|nr:glutamate-5-semialdehyde dehydrogenase [Varunaivibrio sulfuroxidans]WES32174.1 glutamate-5-semialdehyde dehydrogenase [Varunaivibrio sulfuroxidans]
MMRALAHGAKTASRELSQASGAAKDSALRAAAGALRDNEAEILAANVKDVAAGRQKGLSAAMVDRLTLNRERVAAMARGLEDIAALDDPVGAVLGEWTRPNGLLIQRVRVPIGVIGVIYESRPNVTADASALCLKSGNAVILRGGSESFHSNHAIMACLGVGLAAAGLPAASVQLVPTRDRDAVGAMLKMDDLIDVIVPRGGKSLIARITAESKVPLFKHLEGICHTYVDKNADPARARDVVVNAKMRRTGICGATETVLIDAAAAQTLGPQIVSGLLDAGCEVRGDAAVRALDPRVRTADAADWDSEYLDAIVSVKTVEGVDGAIAHIEEHGSHHTDCILTEDADAAERFLNKVDSAIVMLNASTQYADGGEFGMGAEIGIATGKLHARGPVGVEQLTTFKYLVRGQGQCRP